MHCHRNLPGQYSLERLEFADGSFWTKAQIASVVGSGATFAPGAPIFGASGAEVLSGTSLAEFIMAQAGDDTVTAGDGNDVIYGEDGNDQLEGDAGADKLFGGNGSDTLAGGAGADTLDGAAGSDTFLFGSGGGNDTVTDYDGSYTPTDIDRVKLTNLNAGDITLQMVTPGDHLKLTVKATGETLTVDRHFYSTGQYSLERLEFADGSFWTKAQIASVVGSGATFAPGAAVGHRHWPRVLGRM